MTLEEGGTSYKNDQTLYDSLKNTGNVSTPVLGHTLSLSNCVMASYGIRGSSAYKQRFVLPPTRFPGSICTGNSCLASRTPTFTMRSPPPDLCICKTRCCFTTRPADADQRRGRSCRTPPEALARRFDLWVTLSGSLESWLTDRMHGEPRPEASNQVLEHHACHPDQATVLASSLVSNYNQQEIQLFFDVSRKPTLRGGYRYVWCDANSIIPGGLQTVSQSDLHRQVALGGVVFRPSRKLTMSSDAEVATSTGAYFRTSLYNYQKVRAQGRYQVVNSLNLAVDFTLLNNQNPTPGINADAKANQESISLFWAPGAAKHWELQGSYGHSSMRSDIGYLLPQDLSPQTSIYTDNSHTATALFTMNLSGVKWAPHTAAKITAGGSFVRSSGSRPTSYYQPQAKVAVPVAKNIQWVSEWRYYGYGEAFYLYEGFRTHLITTGLRFTR